MKKNQERRLHRKNAKIIKEGGTPMQLNRTLKPDTTVRFFTPRPWPLAGSSH
jgi:transcription initiation factor TFIID subunit 1, fungi type